MSFTDGLQKWESENPRTIVNSNKSFSINIVSSSVLAPELFQIKTWLTYLLTQLLTLTHSLTYLLTYYLVTYLLRKDGEKPL